VQFCGTPTNPCEYLTTPGGAAHRSATESAVQQAITDGAPWVLKPQREGGGNNLYGAELSAFLKEHQGDPVLSGAFSRAQV
jgi:hypothetical protein